MNAGQHKEQYYGEANALLTKVNALRARGRGFVIGEIASFVAIFVFVVLITVSESAAMRIAEGVLAAVMLGVYVLIRNRDVRNSEQMAETERLHKAYRHEAAYLDGDFTAFDDGGRYADPRHPFTYDLDIFGKDSLYQRINRTVTTGGADRLAHYLSSVDAHSTKGLVEYREAIKKLCEGKESFRLYFISCGIDRKIDTEAVLKSLPKLRDIAIPSYLGGKGIKAVAWLLSVGLVASIAAAIYSLVNPMLPIVWLFVNFFIVQGLANKYLKEMLVIGNSLRSQMQPLMRLVRHVVGSDIPYSDKLSGAEKSFDMLTDIVETLTLRGHGVYHFFSDALGLRGLFIVSKFYHWRSIASGNLKDWIGALTEIDALVSMAQFSSNHEDETSEATIITDVSATTKGMASPLPEGEGLGERSLEDRSATTGFTPVVYDAKGLYHPFLGEKAVRNDFSIKNRNFYIITGANMAGKSTFLRAVGVNYILAMNGMPVFADSLTVSRFHLFTSMRTSDDLAHGISYFNAELRRLKQLINDLSDLSDLSPSPSPSETLIILDEILKGTNSLDKLNGSRMFLRAMEQKPVTGIIATHDLELSKMEQEDPRFHNYCFEIKLGTDVTYSYKITPGVARNQNATFLLKQLLSEDNRSNGKPAE